MDHGFKEAAMSASDNAGTRHARAPLGMRIALIVVIALLTAVAGVAAVNLSATITFNQATASLNANIKAAQDESTDVSTLHAQQEQTDAQFAEAGQMRGVLLPQIRDAIDANASISSQLTKITLKKAEAQTEGNTSSQSTEPQQADESSSSNAKRGGALTEEQKKQVEELMKANQQSTDTQTNTKTEQNTDQNKGNTTKPW